MLVWINSIIQTLTPTNIVSSSKTSSSSSATPTTSNNSIELKISPLCSTCIEETLGDEEFTHIDDRRIRVIEGVEDYFSELISKQPQQQGQLESHPDSNSDSSNNNNNNNRNNRNKFGSKTCPSKKHFLTREEILFGVPSVINNSKYHPLQ